MSIAEYLKALTIYRSMDRRFRAKTIRDTLQGTVLFRDLSRLELSLVERIVHLRHYAAGETVFRTGERGLGLYVIHEGAVRIVLDQEDEVREVALLEVGDFFGEVALVEDHAKRSATALAARPTQLIGFFKPDLLELIDRKPHAGVKIAMAIASVLAQRLCAGAEDDEQQAAPNDKGSNACSQATGT
ncbi:MAG: cyclic nucleotide-binding domain-containing protein [Candidatus Schekmanbacteria bacterium]|nr:cyclic nucleotide-binding domain-containing protein [Candidatus Schekmanbacteria bacterium]